jgi:hypothetical protein
VLVVGYKIFYKSVVQLCFKVINYASVSLLLKRLNLREKLGTSFSPGRPCVRPSPPRSVNFRLVPFTLRSPAIPPFPRKEKKPTDNLPTVVHRRTSPQAPPPQHPAAPPPSATDLAAWITRRLSCTSLAPSTFHNASPVTSPRLPSADAVARRRGLHRLASHPRTPSPVVAVSTASPPIRGRRRPPSSLRPLFQPSLHSHLRSASNPTRLPALCKKSDAR